MDIILRLKAQHKQILKSLKIISYCIEKCNDSRLRKEFRDFENLLVDHMQLEDRVYLKLERSKQKELKEMAKIFSKEMLTLSKVILAFFHKYGYLDVTNLKINTKFKEELKNLSEGIKRRVMIEEGILFPAFKKYKF
jgi:regulator of sigma D